MQSIHFFSGNSIYYIPFANEYARHCEFYSVYNKRASAIKEKCGHRKRNRILVPIENQISVIVSRLQFERIYLRTKRTGPGSTLPRETPDEAKGVIVVSGIGNDRIRHREPSIKRT